MDDTLILALVSILTIGLMALYTAYRASGDTREAIKQGGRATVRSAIGNPVLSATLEERANHLPAPLRNGISTILDVYDPIAEATEDDLDDKTKQWIKNLLDNDPSTGAVS